MTLTSKLLQTKEFGALLTEQQARDIFRQGEEAVIFALSQQAKMLHQAQGTSASTPSTPSMMKPLYQKPATRQRRKKLGRKVGHTGSRRRPPEHID